jgi:hypothetical protein
MTDKWADYLISKVQYNEAETHIVKVLSHIDNGESVSGGTELARSTVVIRLGEGSTFVTITKDLEGRWTRGARVRAVTIGGEKYIRTDADSIKRDNLGSLPRF